MESQGSKKSDDVQIVENKPTLDELDAKIQEEVNKIYQILSKPLPLFNLYKDVDIQKMVEEGYAKTMELEAKK